MTVSPANTTSELLDRKLVPSPTVSAAQVGDETILLHLTCGIYFGLDPIGSRIWEELQQGACLRSICNSIAADFPIDQAAVEADALRFVEELLQNDIVRLCEPNV